MLFRIRSRYHAGVIVDDLPAFRKALEDEREDSSHVSFFARQMPAAKNERAVFAEEMKFQPCKIELAHRLPVGIVPVIAFSNCLKSARNSIASRERQFF